MEPFIQRSSHLKQVEWLLSFNPVVAILGARQVGKTTLARQVAERSPSPVTIFDLEDPNDLARLSDPGVVLRALRGLVILDEIQRLPEIFPLLRVLADRPGTPARFLVLGSASPELLQQSSESLAGRIAFHELGGFSVEEVGVETFRRLWWRGGFPLSFLASSDRQSSTWRSSFVRTFIEQDLPQLGVQVPAPVLQRFWAMIAHTHGQLWQGAEIARSLAVSEAGVRRYLDLMTAALVVRQLQPWHENLRKRQVKRPKAYIRDSGLLHTLLGVETEKDLLGHPKFGASWEGFVIEELIRFLGLEPNQYYFWATHSGAEIDLLVVRGAERRGFEIKATEVPRTTRGMHSAFEDLKLDSLDVIHLGQHTFEMRGGIRAVAIERLEEDLGGYRPAHSWE